MPVHTNTQQQWAGTENRIQFESGQYGKNNIGCSRLAQFECGHCSKSRCKLVFTENNANAPPSCREPAQKCCRQTNVHSIELQLTHCCHSECNNLMNHPMCISRIRARYGRILFWTFGEPDDKLIAISTNFVYFPFRARAATQKGSRAVPVAALRWFLCSKVIFQLTFISESVKITGSITMVCAGKTNPADCIAQYMARIDKYPFELNERWGRSFSVGFSAFVFGVRSAEDFFPCLIFSINHAHLSATFPCVAYPRLKHLKWRLAMRFTYHDLAAPTFGVFFLFTWTWSICARHGYSFMGWNWNGRCVGSVPIIIISSCQLSKPAIFFLTDED